MQFNEFNVSSEFSVHKDYTYIMKTTGKKNNSDKFGR